MNGDCSVTTSAVQLACDLINIASVSRDDNAEVIAYCRQWAERQGMEVENLTYTDARGVTKHNLVARAGPGGGGLAFLTHTDTVPGLQGWNPFEAAVQSDRIVGRGSCDMKGPMAAAMAAAAEFGWTHLRKPLYLVFSADEEVGHQGAEHIAARSHLLRNGRPEFGIVTEPTLMEPVYAHKGGAFLAVSARGQAAHSSTEKGDSATFRIAPFMAEMTALKRIFLHDPRFRNAEFDPPTNGFNMTVTDFDTAANVTAAKARCGISVRNMPESGFDAAMAYIERRAAAHGLETVRTDIGYFYGKKDGALMQLLCRLSETEQAVSVPYGTEASVYGAMMETAVWGPGDIAHAHTVGEYITLAQLELGQRRYRELIQEICGPLA